MNSVQKRKVDNKRWPMCSVKSCLRRCSKCWMGWFLLLIIVALAEALLYLIPCIEKCSRNCMTVYVNPETARGILAVAGLVSFPLNFIVSIKSRKIRGFAFDDIAREYFPSYGIPFVVQAISVLFGTFAYYKNRIATLCFCTMCTVLCLTYTFIMALCLVFSENAKTWVAKRYLVRHLKHQKGEESSIRVMTNYCQYLYNKYKEMFATASAALSFDEKEFEAGTYSEVNGFLHDIAPILMPEELQRKPNKRKLQPSDKAPNEFKYSSFDDFKDFLGIRNEKIKTDSPQSHRLLQRYPAECAVLLQCPRFDKQRDEIKKELPPLIDMWEGLLGDKGDLKKRASVIFAILRAYSSEGSSPKRLRLIEISLLICICRRTIQKGQTEKGTGWDETMQLLYNCDTIAIRTHKAMCRRSDRCKTSGIEEALKDLSIMLYAFALLSQASSSARIPLEMIGRIMRSFSWNEGVRNDLTEEAALIYLSYAAVLADQIWLPECYEMTPAEMYLALPLLVRALLNGVNGSVL